MMLFMPYYTFTYTVQVNRMFGAEKFQFYIESSTPEVETCLNKYRQLGVVDVRPWSMPDPLLHPEVSVHSLLR